MFYIKDFNLSLNRSYHIINLVLAGIILCIFIYSFVFSAEKDNHPIPSFYEEISGELSPSSGLSRSFSEIVRGRFQSAREYNQYGISIFIFFLVQFFLRLLISFVLVKKYLSSGKLVMIDVVFSILLFIICFRGLILIFIQNLKQLW
jgi:hypothetical protein